MEGYKGSVQEKRFEYKGFPCVVLMQAMAFRTGYVGLPKENKYFGKKYDGIPVGCHGGLTYSNNSLIDQDDKDTWWIGFDTGHCFDGYDFESAKELFKDYPKTIKQIEAFENIHCQFHHNEDNSRSLAYVEDECKSIVDQLLSEE